MTRTIEVSAWYKADADQLFESALRFSELSEAMAGLATYSGFPASDTASEGDTIVVDVVFFGFFRQSGHTMFIERLDPKARIIQSRESGIGIRRWDHTLSIQSDGPLARWTDTVVIDAGWQSPILARFAASIYRRRHKHRQALKLTSRIMKSVEA